MNHPTHPTTPSDSALAQAFREAEADIFSRARDTFYTEVFERAREIDAQRPTASATKAEGGNNFEEWFKEAHYAENGYVSSGDPDYWNQKLGHRYWARRGYIAGLEANITRELPAAELGKLQPPAGDSFSGWAAWLRDQARSFDPYIQQPHAEMLAQWLDRRELAAQPAPACGGVEAEAALIGNAFKEVLRHPDHKWRETGAQPFIDMVAQRTGELWAATPPQAASEGSAPNATTTSPSNWSIEMTTTPPASAGGS